MTRFIHQKGTQKHSEGHSNDHEGITGPAADKFHDFKPWVTPAIYSFVLVDFHTEIHFCKQPKLRLNLRIVDVGEYFGVILPRWYNVDRLLSKAGKNGRFKPPAYGHFMIEYLTLFRMERRPRLDRISMRPFKGCVIRGRVGTVITNSEQRRLPEPLQHSTVRELLEVGA